MTSILADSLFRSAELSERKKYVKLVEDVKGYGGTVHIFSSLHVSGEKVRFPNDPIPAALSVNLLVF